MQPQTGSEAHPPSHLHIYSVAIYVYITHYLQLVRVIDRIFLFQFSKNGHCYQALHRLLGKFGAIVLIPNSM